MNQKHCDLKGLCSMKTTASTTDRMKAFQMSVPAVGICMTLLVLFQLDHLLDTDVNERVILK